MLSYLAVNDLATIDGLELEFEPGLNTITGATGAGKSVLIGALGLVLGERADTDAVRSGAKAAEINAVFTDVDLPPELAERLGLESPCPELIVRRRIAARGRSRAWLNGAVVPVSTLAELGDQLIDLHGQHEHQALLKSRVQLELLDAYGGLEDELEATAAAHRRVRDLERELERLEGAAVADRRQLELWRHELEEIRGAEIDPAEENELHAERKRLRAVVELTRSARAALVELAEGDGCALDRLDQGRRELDELGRLDETQEPLAAEVSELRFTLEGSVDKLRNYLEDLEADPGRLEEIEQRLAQLEHLKRKFGPDLETVVEYGDWVAGQLSANRDRGAALEEKRRELAAARDAYLEKAGELAAARRRSARGLVPEVNAVLERLGFVGEPFAVAIEPRPGDDGWCVYEDGPTRAALNGLDVVELLLSANPGEPRRPLTKVASGGEIARVMLAVKRVMGERYGVPVMVFDEIDSGIGGHAAGVVAELLAELGGRRQVIAITHLPQIAAVADAHFRVDKSAREGRSYTSVERLGEDGRIDELAAMLGGGPSAADHARELLRRAPVDQ